MMEAEGHSLMSNSRDKLNEAYYFFERMSKNQNNPDLFRYNLSAFLAAARSVTFFVQEEYSKVNGFQEWYSTQRKLMGSDELMKTLKDKRDITIHREPLSPHAHVNVTACDTATVSEGLVLIKYDPEGHEVSRIERRDLSKRASEPKPPIVEWKWYFAEIPKIDVLAACAQYIKKLDDSVSESETRFSPV